MYSNIINVKTVFVCYSLLKNEMKICIKIIDQVNMYDFFIKIVHMNNAGYTCVSVKTNTRELMILRINLFTNRMAAL